MGDWERAQVVERAPRLAAHGHEDVATVLVTVKAYPAIGKKTGEAVCVAGVRLDREKPEWIRLFPVGFRDLPADKQFKKYQVLKLKVLPATSDRRPESLKPDLSSLRVGDVVAAASGWAHRQALMEPLIGATTTCELLAGVRADAGTAPSLGLIKPRVTDFSVAVNPAYQAVDAGSATTDLFGHPKDLLEESPVIAKFKYRCASRDCGGHQQSLIDWESGQLARRNRNEHGEAAMLRLHRERFLDERCSPDRDIHFYVGNMHQHPGDFLVLGLWSPPANVAGQATLGL
ncbi:MAG: hypothetical protein CVT68_01750 [Actinobacteria bacterium HGW-Actinobacteria-8]|nr:MAG: hypothetical protein CVT68_01750 [Actinobacteria bacterium HGW-Actinobacteria-8]